MLSAPIGESEIKSALWAMKANKITGSEGLPLEFYREFYVNIKGVLQQVIVDAAKNGFSQNSSRGIITLIEKQLKQLLSIKSWRPLSLLNTDYKLLSKILALRLNKILPRLINKNQSGFLKNRDITDNIMTLISSLEHCERYKIDTMLISFDFESAFDRVEWDVLFKIMHKFGIMKSFTDMIRALYRDIESCTINQGYSSQYIKISQGLRQGDPLSSSLFVLMVEILGEKIRSNPKIQGIDVKNTSNTHAQYADDLWAIILGTQTNLDEIFNTVNTFCKMTGFDLNYNKTEIVKIGSLHNGNSKYYSQNQIKWSTGTKILGIIIDADRKKMIEKNYNVLLSKIRNVLNIWKARSLTLTGRVLIVNTLIASLATQKFTCLPTPPESFFKGSNKLI